MYLRFPWLNNLSNQEGKKQGINIPPSALSSRKRAPREAWERDLWLWERAESFLRQKKQQGSNDTGWEQIHNKIENVQVTGWNMHVLEEGTKHRYVVEIHLKQVLVFTKMQNYTLVNPKNLHGLK